MKKEIFDVIGMTCAACQANVTKAVSRLEGVESVDVSLLSNSMKVEYDPDQVTTSQIEEAVDHIGYEAVSKNKILDESQSDSIQNEWETRQKRVEQEIREKRQSLTVSIVLLLILMCFSMLPMFGIFTFLMDMKWMMVSSVMQLVLCMLILFFQRSFFIHGFKALFKGAPNMDSLVAVGSSASFLYGLYGILYMAYGYGVMDHHMIHSAMDALYFEGAAMIVTLVSLGKYLEARSKAKTGDALGKLIDLAPKSAVIEKNGVEIQVASDQVVSGDIVVIRPGQRIPVDGIVTSGVGYVDQAAITGESVPVEKHAGDSVMSATINVNGTFKFEATKVGSDTTLAQIIRLVDEAGNSKAPIARLADTVAGYFVPVVMGIAALTFIGWMLAGQSFSFALSNAICVLVISCPCALGLATPLAIMVATGKAAEYGVLVKSAASLESLHAVKTVVLDKTGTITSGRPEVTDIQILDPAYTQTQFLQLAAGVETGSEHPLGKAIVEKARAEQLHIPVPESFEAISGRGLKAVLNGHSIAAGNQAFMEEQHIAIDPKTASILAETAGKGQTPLIFANGNRIIGIIAVADTVRPTSAAALQALRALGIQTVMLTGDNARTAKAIAAPLAIDQVVSDVLPADKEKVIADLQARGQKVAMVGDGINDAPALTRADVGIAIGAGTDIAIESADIVLMKDNLMDVVTAIELSRKTMTNIKENLFWAFFYNCLGIPVAMGLLYPAFGWLLNPMWGAAAMSFSSITVCLNALRLRFFRPRHETASETVQQKVSRHTVEQEERVIENLPDILMDQARREEEDTIVLDIQGMSCDHCVKRVTQALESVPGVRQAQVSLDPGSALVWGQHLQAEALIQAVKDAGYEAAVQTQSKDETAGKQTAEPTDVSMPKKDPDLFSWTFTVEGMSCEHCQNRVEQALKSLPGMQTADVDLKTGLTVCTANRDIPAAEIENAIEEAGYILKWPESPVRTWKYTLKIQGMMCDHCKQHVESALSEMQGIIKAEADPQTGLAVIVSTEPLDLQKAAKAIEEAGYTFAGVKQEEITDED